MRFIFLIFLSLFTLPCFATDKISVRAEEVGMREFSSKYNATGLCKEALSREFIAKVEGVVDNIFIQNNQSVTRGQVILTIDQSVAEATKNKAIELYNASGQSYSRDINLFKKAILSKEALDNSKVTLENARLDLALAVKQYEDMVIAAPFDGEIGVIHPQIGDNIKVGDYIFTIISPGTKHVILELPENLYKKITLQSQALVTDISGEKIAGKIVSISDYLKSNGNLSVKVEFSNNANILHGSYVNVEFVFNVHNALSINSKALLKNNTGNFIFKIDQGVAKQVYIKIGERDGENTEIFSSDLKVGDKIVTEGLTKVSEGAKINIITES